MNLQVPTPDHTIVAIIDPSRGGAHASIQSPLDFLLLCNVHRDRNRRSPANLSSFSPTIGWRENIDTS
jgi:hypothetical protein